MESVHFSNRLFIKIGKSDFWGKQGGPNFKGKSQLSLILNAIYNAGFSIVFNFLILGLTLMKQVPLEVFQPTSIRQGEICLVMVASTLTTNASILQLYLFLQGYLTLVFAGRL